MALYHLLDGNENVCLCKLYKLIWFSLFLICAILIAFCLPLSLSLEVSYLLCQFNSSNITLQILLSYCHTPLAAEAGRISSSTNGIHVDGDHILYSHNFSE